MSNLGKIGFDPGHYAGANAGPGAYREGDAMLKFGLALQKAYGAYLTRTDGKDLDLYQRCKKAKDAGCNTLISLHTNAPEAAKGIIIFFSLKRPQDRIIAEAMGEALAKATGLSFRGAKTRAYSAAKPDVDYYGILRHGVNLGLDHVFIVEHGSHWEFAVDTDKKIAACVEAYGEALGLKPAGLTYEQAVEITAKFANIDVNYWLAKKDIDKYFGNLMIKIAEAIQKGEK